MDYAKKIVYQSNYWYNDGLKRAQIRDMSGAIDSLRRSLQFNSENIAARNLLGLVYYGIGEVPEALVQWIISKNLRSTDNIADYYIRKVQAATGELDAVNQAIRKYNQCLAYCRQNGEDLALIQLKQVVQAHPSYLQAQQLLALLYLRTAQYSRARQVLKTARQLDTSNEKTLRYIYELSTGSSKKVRKTEKKQKETSVEYNVGNETIIQPKRSAVREITSRFAVANLFIGAAIGAAIVWFLIAPAMNQNSSDKLNNQMRAYSDQINALHAQISAQTRTLDEYRATAENAEEDSKKAALTADSYESLIKVLQEYETRQYSSATLADNLFNVNRDALKSNGQAYYDDLAEKIFPDACDTFYANGTNAMYAGNYDTAIEAFQKIMKIDETYNKGRAMYSLGEAYMKNDDNDNAKIYLEKFLENYSGSYYADDAQEMLDEINGVSGDTDNGAGSQDDMSGDE